MLTAVHGLTRQVAVDTGRNLVAAATIRDEPPQYRGDLLSDAATTVLIAVGEAVTQLEAIRLRRGIENAAFDNVWRG